MTFAHLVPRATTCAPTSCFLVLILCHISLFTKVIIKSEHQLQFSKWVQGMGKEWVLESANAGPGEGPGVGSGDLQLLPLTPVWQQQL